ncbi:4071_t:CDS:2, partial [Cetraspora pellucida]
IVYVNNPPIDIDDEDELELNKSNRIKSRKILFEHLNKNCQEISYKPPKLANLSKEIVSFMKEKIELQKQLEELKEPKEIKSTSSQPSKSKSENVSAEKKQKVVDVNKSGVNTNFFSKVDTGIFRKRIKKEKKELLKPEDEEINRLEKEKRKLRKEIEKKEKVIRQKTLGNNFQPTCAEFCAWLRDNKQLTTEELLNHDIKQLKSEYCQQLEKEVEIFDKYKKKQLEKSKKYTLTKESFQQLIKLTFSVEVAQAYQAAAKA